MISSKDVVLTTDYMSNNQAVKVKHIKTGITLTCDTERLMHENKAKVIAMLETELEKKK